LERVVQEPLSSLRVHTAAVLTPFLAFALAFQGSTTPTPFGQALLTSPNSPRDDGAGADLWASYGYSLFGGAVARVGDVDVDGLPDFLVANPGLYGDRGIVWVLSGRNGTVLHKVESDETGDGFGHDIQAAGDVDADGHPDWIVGSLVEKSEGSNPLHPSDRNGPRAEVLQGILLRRDPGYAAVFSGRTGERLLLLTGERRGDLFGFAVGGAGDLDGDGRVDILASAPRALEGRGRVYVYSGIDGKLLRHVDGTSTDDHLGGDLCAAGDLDGDGRIDLAVALMGGDDTRILARTFSGRTGDLLWSVERGPRSGFYGVRVGTGGDLDGDGRSEFLIAYSGGIEILSGASGAVSKRFEGSWIDRYGGAVDILQDADGSGPIDLVVGQPRLAASAGSVLVIELDTHGSIHTIDAPDDMFFFGHALASLGDLNGDGRSDFVVGTDNTMSHTHGQVRVYSGRTREQLMEITRSKNEILVKR
jgi:hypothetical protein